MKQKVKEKIEKHINVWYLITIIIIIVTIVLFFVLRSIDKQNKAFVFNEHLDDTAISVGTTDISLREAAYYIIIMESSVNETAMQYNENSPFYYWNIYMNDGKDKSNFLRTQAKEEVINICIRDEIYYQEAKKTGVVLDEEEVKKCTDDANIQERALTGKQIDVTKYEYRDVYKAINKIYIIKKYISMLMDEGYTEEELELDGDYYEKLKANYDIDIKEEIWNEITLGELTVN